MKKISAYIIFLVSLFINEGFTQDTIAVISPNGGESWVADSSHTITWSDNFDPQVKIELFKGGAFLSLIKASTISNGVYEWEINKGIPSDSDYTVKISSTVNSNVFDFSDENFTIIANEVTVTSPNGGEDWKAGTTQMITWTDNFDENVKIDLNKAGVFLSSLTGSTPSNGSFNWNIPFDFTGGSDYSIRIASVQTSSVVFDNSDGNFTITPNQITVTSPNGGEIWRTVVPQTITWNDNLAGTVKIELYQGGQDPGDLHSVLTISTPSTGSFLWNVTTDVVPANDYLIKITSNLNNNIFDFSDTTFTFIKEITVLSPNGGELPWLVGTQMVIGWTDNITERVSIDLFKSDTLYTIIEFSTSSDGTNNWNIPESTTPGSDYKIKISSVVDPEVFDFSDNNFTIVGFSMMVLSPNGGEAWLVGSRQTIAWNDDFPGNASIDLFKSDTLYTIIEFSTGSDGSYNWDIPDSTTPGSDYKIKISSVDDPGVFDFSDNNFTIVGFKITVKTPNGGEQWLIGDRRDITWSDNIDENVKIDLYKGGLFHSTIAFSSSGADEVERWDIPLSGISQGEDYRIRITSVDDITLFDFSDGDFILFLPKITITSPNGGETWQSGTRHTIAWTDAIDEAVQIDLYRSDTLYSPISPSTSSDGAFTWNIPDTTEAGFDYKIMIKSATNDIIFDFSDGNFTLFLPKIAITSPNGGEIWEAGTRHTITWTDAIDENVQIDLYKSDTLYGPIELSTSSDGAFPWNIPDTTEAGFDYKIIIKSTVNDNIIDLSDGNFTIKTVPDGYILSQNYPNPFNPLTTIKYGIPEDGDGRVLLEVFDITGQKLFTLVDEEKISGFYEVQFENSVLPSGVYFYRIVTGKFVDFKKMILLK